MKTIVFLGSTVWTETTTKKRVKNCVDKKNDLNQMEKQMTEN